MKKIIIIVSLILIALIITGGAYFWYMMQQPLCQPGMVRSQENLRAPLEPPAQPEDSPMWQVEAEIELAHFAEGEGRNVLIVHGGPGMPYSEPWAGLQPLTGT
jgi:proline iminopeptidase